MKTYKFYLIIVFTLTSSCLFAQDYEGEFGVESNKVRLRIQPNICVAPRGKESCISSIDIFWESDFISDYCLFSDSVKKTKLKCWNDSKKGKYIHKLILKEKLVYWMKEKGSNIELVSSVLKFATLKPHRKHQRRRNRLPWSLSSL